MGIIQQLQGFNGFTASERAIVKVIFQNPDLLRESTASEIAKAAYTSPSTVTRLCQKLGCKNYNDFRVSFISEMGNQQYKHTFIDASIPFRKGDSLEEILHLLTELQSTTLQTTASLIDLNRYRRVIRMLADAKCIRIYGTGLTLRLAYSFLHMMASIHRSVWISMDYHEQALSAVTPHKGDCAIVISYSGETANSLEYASLLRKAGTPVIAITSAGDSSLAQYADELLFVASQENSLSRIGPFTSCTSIMAILHFLYAGIFALDYDKNYDRLLSTVLQRS